MEKRNIYIVEDHQGMRELLREFIDSTPDMCTCGMAETAEQAVEELSDATVHLLLIDVSLPGMTGLDLARKVQNAWPTLPFLIMSGHRDSTYAKQALKQGANGYVTKGDPDELIGAIRCVLDGEIYIDPSIQNTRAGRG